MQAALPLNRLLFTGGQEAAESWLIPSLGLCSLALQPTPALLWPLSRSCFGGKASLSPAAWEPLPPRH